MKRKILKNEYGTTLLEMVLVLAILGVFMTIITESMPAFIQQAHRVRALKSGQTFRVAAEQVAALAIADNEKIPADYPSKGPINPEGGNQREYVYWDGDFGKRVMELLGGEEEVKKYFQFKNYIKVDESSNTDFKLILNDDGTINSTKGSKPGEKPSIGSYVKVRVYGTVYKRYFFATNKLEN